MALPTPVTFNPYRIIGDYYVDGLDYIIDALTTDPPSTPSVDDLVNAVYTYVNGLSWFETTPGYQETEIKAVAYNAINSFIDGQMGNYNPVQNRLISMMIGPSFINGLTVDTLEARLLDIQDKVGTSGISPMQQTPLFLATIVGSKAYGYFLNAIGTPDNWEPYFDAALVSPIVNLPFWLAAAMKGALIGANPSPGCKGGMIDPSTTPASNQIIQSLISALTITVGRIIFGWIPRIKDIQPAIASPGFYNGAPRGGISYMEQKCEDKAGVKFCCDTSGTCHDNCYYDSDGMMHCPTAASGTCFCNPDNSPVVLA